MKLEEIKALFAAAMPGTWIKDARADRAIRALLPLLLDVAEAAFRLHDAEDSPTRDARLRYDDALFDLGKARLDLEAAQL